MKKWFGIVMILVFAAFIAACGGGGGGDSVTVTPSPNPEPVGTDNAYSMGSFASGTAYLTFELGGINGGLISPVNPADVEYIQWRGDAAGWGINSPATGALMSDADGVLFAKVANMPSHDRGNFVAKLKDGTVVWFNLGIWLLPQGATFNPADGTVSY
jgi:hypothetical protein